VERSFRRPKETKIRAAGRWLIEERHVLVCGRPAHLSVWSPLLCLMVEWVKPRSTSQMTFVCACKMTA
jgi:hypothetical protein